MIKNLAIMGHATRGREVIELLEMMGGTNKDNIFFGKDLSCIYFIDGYGFIRKEIIENNIHTMRHWQIFTLEEFLEKYPFRVGDKVIDDSGEDGIIIEMKWDEEIKHIKYKVDFGKECYYFASYYLRPFDGKCERTHEDVIFDSIIWHLRNSVNNGKQNLSGGECEEYFREVVKKNNENKMKSVLAELFEHIKTTSKEDLEREFKEIESERWTHVGPTVEEFMDFCDKVNKKPKYPKTYEECIALLYLQDSIVEGRCGYEWRLISNLQKLLLCRDAYWKIAGEEMGLNGSWEPNWNEETDKFTISNKCNKIYLNNTAWYAEVLSFPTAEMRDAFYENFKDLIESCKELL